MSPDVFQRVYSDAELRDFIADMARRLSPTAEAAEDAEQECWLCVAAAPDNVSVNGLRDAIVASVASAVYMERKPSRAVRRWISILRDYNIMHDDRQGMI